jgi:signal transduction histidine kinase
MKSHYRLILSKVLTIAILLSYHTRAGAQDTSAVFGHSALTIYNQDKGLPQSTVYSVIFDNLGFLWIATTDGVVRFDGRKIKLYPYIQKNTNIAGFVRVNKDTIFAFHSSCDKVVVITGGEVQKTIKFNPVQYGYPLLRSQCFLPVEVSKCIFGADKITPDKTHITTSLTGLQYGKDSFALMTNDSLLKIFSSPCSHYLPLNILNNAQKDLAQQSSLHFILINNTFAYLNSNKGLITLYNLKGKLKDVTLPSSTKGTWKLVQSDNNRRFYLQHNALLYQVEQNPATGDLLFTLLLTNFPQVLPSIIINKDNETLLTGTLNDGFYVYTKQHFKTLQDPALGQTSSFYSQVLMPDNKTVLTGKTKLFNEQGMIKSLPEVSAVSTWYTFRDSYNNFWFENSTQLYKTTNPETTAPHTPITMPGISQYFEDSKKNVWIYSSHKWGYFKPGSDTFFEFNANKNDSISDQLGYINSIAETTDGTLLLAGTNGIYSFNPGKPAYGFKPYALIGVEVRHIEFIKPTRNIWAATKGKGLCSIKNNGESITFFPKDKNGDMRTVHYFLTDGDGMTWLSTNNGLFVTTKKSLLDFDSTNAGQPFFYKISKTNGLSSNELNGGCQSPMLLLPDGSLTASSIAGLVWTRTSDLTIKFNNHPLLLTKIDSAQPYTFTTDTTLYLDHSQNNNVSFALSFADWNEDFNIETAYIFGDKSDISMLQWQPLSSDNKVTFPHLATGEYIFRIRKKTGFGLNDYTYFTLNIKVTPQWFETKWFYFLATLLLAGLTLLLVFLRNRHLQKANRLLTKRIDEATEELFYANNQLIKSNETKDILITLFNHDISVPIFYVNQMLLLLAQNREIKSLLPSEAQDINLISNTVYDLNILMGDLLYWVKMQRHNTSLQVNYKDIDPRDIINSTLNLFRFRIDFTAINLSVDVEEGLMITTDEHLFSSILYNVISNAVKYTQKGFLSIDAQTDPDNRNNFLLRVENSTVPRNTKPPLTNHYLKQPVADENQSRNIGLVMVQDFAMMLGYTLHYELRTDSIFTVMITGGIYGTKKNTEKED